eukprot:TRINITY_DN64744_c0_g1_i1.p2 TRINITY_DN64744_c0_g1~~TRINITY_DN64744_c0_g1_i1.p2  ORF type:complete len:175 (+),score=44.17 TRINITY_DN64744_c0_g1_i1:802-1326(+)
MIFCYFIIIPSVFQIAKQKSIVLSILAEMSNEDISQVIKVINETSMKDIVFDPSFSRFEASNEAPGNTKLGVPQVSILPFKNIASQTPQASTTQKIETYQSPNPENLDQMPSSPQKKKKKKKKKKNPPLLPLFFITSLSDTKKKNKKKKETSRTKKKKNKHTPIEKTRRQQKQK